MLDSLSNPVNTTDYLSGLHYENDTLREAQHAEGRVSFGAAGARYDYALRDHLGNTRLLFSDTDSSGCPEALQVNDYYPFGLGHHTGTAAQGADYPYLYNGKELQEELGLGWYDYGARFYQPETGRWNGMDALGEKYWGWSPFNYVMGNPVIMVDPDGRNTTVFMWQWVEQIDDEGNKTRQLTITFLTTVQDKMDNAFTFVDQATGDQILQFQAKGLNAFRSTEYMKQIRERNGSIDKEAWDVLWSLDDYADKFNQERAAVLTTDENGKTIVALQGNSKNTEKSANHDFTQNNNFYSTDFPNKSMGEKYSNEEKKIKNWISYHTHYTNGGPPSGNDFEFYRNTPGIKRAGYHLITEKQVVGNAGTKFLQVIINTGTRANPKYSGDAVGYVKASEIASQTFKK